MAPTPASSGAESRKHRRRGTNHNSGVERARASGDCGSQAKSTRQQSEPGLPNPAFLRALRPGRRRQRALHSPALGDEGLGAGAEAFAEGRDEVEGRRLFDWVFD